MATVLDRVVMCAETEEFVAAYNRLYGASLNFKAPQRSAIERLVDDACNHAPGLVNNPDELAAFVRHLVDLWCRLPEVQAAEKARA
jgi:hypothetical protein